MTSERRRRLFRSNPLPSLLPEANLDAAACVARFGRMLERRSGELAERRRTRAAGPSEVDEAWDDLMRPARRPSLPAVLVQEGCVLLSGLLLSAAGGVVWVKGEGQWPLAAALAVGAAGVGLAGAVLRVASRV